MKQTFTIEDDLAMIIDLLTGMVESGEIKQDDADLIIEQYIELQTCKSLKMSPGKHVLAGIMNYSRSLCVWQQRGTKPRAIIIN